MEKTAHTENRMLKVRASTERYDFGGKMSGFKVRTDLALEARENVEESAEELRGVTVDENYDEETEVKVTRVIIESKNSARVLGKPIGTYITLEAPAMALPDEEYHKEISDELARQLRAIDSGNG